MSIVWSHWPRNIQGPRVENESPCHFPSLHLHKIELTITITIVTLRPKYISHPSVDQVSSTLFAATGISTALNKACAALASHHHPKIKPLYVLCLENSGCHKRYHLSAELSIFISTCIWVQNRENMVQTRISIGIAQRPALIYHEVAQKEVFLLH